MGVNKPWATLSFAMCLYEKQDGETRHLNFLIEATTASKKFFLIEINECVVILIRKSPQGRKSSQNQWLGGIVVHS